MIPHPDMYSLMQWLTDEELKVHSQIHNSSNPAFIHDKQVEQRTISRIISHIATMHHKQSQPHLQAGGMPE